MRISRNFDLCSTVNNHFLFRIAIKKCVGKILLLDKMTDIINIIGVNIHIIVSIFLCYFLHY